MNAPDVLRGRRVILFDLDGTLYDPVSSRSYLDEVDRITGLRVQEIYGADDPREGFARLEADRKDRGFASLGETLQAAWGIGLAEMNRWRERWTRPERFLSPDRKVREAIEALLERHVLIIGTNASPRIARAILRVLELPEAWFAGIFASEDVGVAKPARAFFEAVCERTGFPPSAFVSVGDRPSSDLVPAAELGMGTWLVKRSHDIYRLASISQEHGNAS